jgi:S1-C subfamily serine protease
VDAAGQVIGINTAGADQAQGINFAIAINTAKPILEDLRTANGGTLGTSGAYLGITPVTLTPTIASRLGIGVDKGVIIEQVSPQSPADQAGIRPADVITAMDGQPVGSTADLRRVLRSKKPGDRLDLSILRDGKQETITVVTGRR